MALVLLDATRHAPIPPDCCQVLQDQRTTPAATDDGVASYETKKLTVVESEGAEVGRTVTANAGAEVRVALTVAPERCERVFVSTLNGGAITIDRTVGLPQPNRNVTFAHSKCTHRAPPPWSQLGAVYAAAPDSRSVVTVEMEEGPISLCASRPIPKRLSERWGRGK